MNMVGVHIVIGDWNKNMENKVEHAGMVGIFTTPVFLSTIVDETIIDNAVDNVLKLKETTPGVERINNWVTDDNLQTLPEFKELADILLQESKRALDEMTVIRDSDYITCMWANEAPIGTAHAEHIHSNSLWSGVLYLRVPEGSSPTLFSDPRPIANMIRPDYENASPYFLGARWGQIPKKGNMIIFPSWLPHSVETVPAVEDAETRIVLSWNIMIRSKVQFDTAKIEY